jgi:hypothetical protein
MNARGREERQYDSCESDGSEYEGKMDLSGEYEEELLLADEVGYPSRPIRENRNLDRSGERSFDVRIERYRDEREERGERADRRTSGGRSGSCTERPDKYGGERERRDSDRSRDDKDCIPRERRTLQPSSNPGSSPKTLSPYRSGADRTRTMKGMDERESSRSDRDRDRERDREARERKRREKSSDRDGRRDRSRELEREKIPLGGKLSRVGSSYTIREGREEKEEMKPTGGSMIMGIENRPRERGISAAARGLKLEERKTERSGREERERREREEEFLRRRREENPYWDLLLAVDSLWQQDEELDLYNNGEVVNGVETTRRTRTLPALGAAAGNLTAPVMSLLGKYLMIRWTAKPRPTPLTTLLTKN